MSSLLAKSPRRGVTVSLFQHLCQTEEAAVALFRAGSRWGRSFLRFFKLEEADHARFLLNLRVAALFHDIGKANEGFQRAMVPLQFTPQGLRHEHLSALVLAHPDVERWLGENPMIDQDVILAAVLSHHLKAAPDEGPWQVLASRNAAPTALFFDDPQVIAAFETISNTIGVPAPALVLPRRYDDRGWDAAWDAFWNQRVPRFARSLRVRGSEPRRALTLAVKAGLIVADSVASGLFRADTPMERWIEEVAHMPAIAPGAIERDIIAPRILEIEQRGRFRSEDFQAGAAALGRRGLLLAPAGAGKTLAAWRWADAVSRTEAIGRVIYLYPKRGTATEALLNCVGRPPEGAPALGIASPGYELAGMLRNPAEMPLSLPGQSIIPDEAQLRWASLRLWPKRFFSATVEHFLSFLEHDYGGLCLLPVLADAAVVFDEIHTYDRGMWNALIAFLDHFDVPVLCTTAALPPARYDALARRLCVYPDTGRDRVALADLERAETRPRYHVRTAGNEEAALQEVEARLRETPDARVLWVVNTVRRCQQLAVRLRARLERDVIVYHSRFKLSDRQSRHRHTLAAFQRTPGAPAGGAIAVTTQVCEMSFDLDADILITEHAPISTLVQRFGRANRHADRDGRDPAFRALLLTYPPETAVPYDPAELGAASQFLAALCGPDVTQRDLALGLDAYAPPERTSSGASRFLEAGFFATPGALRDSDDSGVIAVLDRDLPLFHQLTARGESTEGLRFKLPQSYAISASQSARLPTWLHVVQGSKYSEWLGFVAEEEPAHDRQYRSNAIV